MLDPALPLELRASLMRHYGLSQLFANSKDGARRIERAFGTLIAHKDQEGPARVFTLDARRLAKAAP
jgi:hypothetical protein